MERERDSIPPFLNGRNLPKLPREGRERKRSLELIDLDLWPVWGYFVTAQYI